MLSAPTCLGSIKMQCSLPGSCVCGWRRLGAVLGGLFRGEGGGRVCVCVGGSAFLHPLIRLPSPPAGFPELLKTPQGVGEGVLERPRLGGKGAAGGGSPGVFCMEPTLNATAPRGRGRIKGAGGAWAKGHGWCGGGAGPLLGTPGKTGPCGAGAACRASWMLEWVGVELGLPDPPEQVAQVQRGSLGGGAPRSVRVEQAEDPRRGRCEFP